MLQVAQACKCQNIHLPDWNMLSHGVEYVTSPLVITKWLIVVDFHRHWRNSVSVKWMCRTPEGSRSSFWVSCKTFSSLFTKINRQGPVYPPNAGFSSWKDTWCLPVLALQIPSGRNYGFLACLEGWLVLNLLSAHRKQHFFKHRIKQKHWVDTMAELAGDNWERKWFCHKERRVFLHRINAASQHK